MDAGPASPAAGITAAHAGSSISNGLPGPLQASDLATHVLWKLECRSDISHAIRQYVSNVERGDHSLGVVAADQDVAVRSLLALTSLAYNVRLRDQISSCPGFLKLVVQRAISVEEPALSSAYLGLLCRLTFRTCGDGGLAMQESTGLLDWLVCHICNSADPSALAGARADPTLWVCALANVTRASSAARAYVKARPSARELYKTLAQLLAGPGVLGIVLALQSLANLVLHDELGTTLFGEDNVRRVFDLVFSLVKDSDRDDQSHHALLAAADLISDLCSSPHVLVLVERGGGASEEELSQLLEVIATMRHSLDSVLPLLELVCALLRPPTLRASLWRAVHNARAERNGILGALMSLAACPHPDVASAAAMLVSTLCRSSRSRETNGHHSTFAHTMANGERLRSLDALVETVKLGVLTNKAQPPTSLLDTDAALPTRLRCRAACQVLCELAHMPTFSDTVHRRLHVVPFAQVARCAAQSGDGALLLALLLLAFRCWEGVSLGVRRELLLFARSSAVMDIWTQMMTSSTDPQLLHECLLLACHLVTMAVDPSADASGGLSAWVELQGLEQALAARHSTRAREVDDVFLKMQRLQAGRSEEQEEARCRSAALEAELSDLKQAQALERRQQAHQLSLLSIEVEHERHRAEQAADAAAREAGSLMKAYGRQEATERKLQEAELTHADILQRAARAEGLCRQLGAKMHEQDEQLRRVLEDREGLLGEVERRQQAERSLLDAREAEEQLKAENTQLHSELRRERAALIEVQENFEGQLRQAKAETEDLDVEAQRKAALQDEHAEDLGRQLASAATALQSVESERDDALREASWLRCELAALQRLEQDREHRSRILDAEMDSTHQALSAAEHRLRERELEQSQAYTASRAQQPF